MAISIPNRWAVTLCAAMVLAACGGGGGHDPVSSNRAPVANAGADQTVVEQATVQLLGSGSDADGDNLTYSWSQLSGPTVIISNRNSAIASFIAPDLSVAPPPGTTVTVTGKVNYEFVPPAANCNGLDFSSTEVRPIRGATVQLLDLGVNSETLSFELVVSDGTATVRDTVEVTVGVIFGSTVASDSGDYTFTDVPSNSTVQLRVRSELKKTTGTSTWDVEVRDNYDDSEFPPPLEDRPLYVAQWAAFDSGITAVNVIDRTATTGWDGTSYTGDRAAAPFSILDQMYTAMRFVELADSNTDFLPLDVFWSVNNTIEFSGNIDLGHLGSSFYRPGAQQLFLVGDASTDTEEFDDHVVLHEWGHYFEDVFSRSDSIGGPHAIGESLDARLSFGEGWASALAAMITNDPIYCDTGVAGELSGFGLDTESQMPGESGWFNEWNVATFVYDLWDTNDDGTDDGSIGWDAIYGTMIGPQANTRAFTSLFSYATEQRKSVDATGQALIDSQLDRYDVVSGADIDIWASNETNAPSDPADPDKDIQDVFPLYTDYTADGTVFNICVNNELDGLDRHGNNVAEDRYLRLAIPATSQYDVSVITTNTDLPPDDPNDDRDQSDPDIYIYSGPELVAWGISPTANSETFRTPGELQAGLTYIAWLEEWRFEDELASTEFPTRICFDVSFTPVS